MGAEAKSAVVIFARHPGGRVKTRLIPRLGAKGAQALHRACLQATALLAASLPTSVDKFLYLTAPKPREARRAARTLELPKNLAVQWQGRGSLGTKLERAFRTLWKQGYERVAVIGSDSPTLTRPRLLEALASLHRREAVLGPARDGGFYLIGLRRTAAKGLFNPIAWGTPRAFREMRRNLRAAGLRVRRLRPGYDVDTPADLRRLAREVPRGRRRNLEPLRRWLRTSRKGSWASASGAC